MDPPSNLIVVCGLGRMGLACLRTLLQFETTLRCLDQTPPPWRDGDGLAALADALVIGDMRHPEALIRASVREARAVLLLSSDSGLNLEAALQVRLLNPSARVVVRSNGSLGLERHLRERLPGLALVDPELLTAGVFANALRPDGSEAAFACGEEFFRVVRSVLPSDSAEDLFCLQGRQQRLLQWCPAQQGSPGPPASHWWDQGAKPLAGDHLLWLEAVSSFDSRRPGKGNWLQDTRTRWWLALESPGVPGRRHSTLAMGGTCWSCAVRAGAGGRINPLWIWLSTAGVAPHHRPAEGGIHRCTQRHDRWRPHGS